MTIQSEVKLEPVAHTPICDLTRVTERQVALEDEDKRKEKEKPAGLYPEFRVPCLIKS